MVDPEVRDWERLRKEIPAIEVASIDEQMKVYLNAAQEELNKEVKETEWWKQHIENLEDLERRELADFNNSWDTAQEESHTESDVVNSPSHYNSGGIECIDAIEESMTEEGFKAYCKGNVQKYLWRYEMKGKPLEDLKKAQWYLTRLIKSQEIEDGY